MKISFTVNAIIAAKPDVVYNGWLDSKVHSEMTGGRANVSNKAGEGFQAWDDYISGTNLELTAGKRIYQKWRTSEFEDSDEDSLLEILFESDPQGTLITLNHSNLPAHGMQYKQGWIDAYFQPMQDYFCRQA